VLGDLRDEDPVVAGIPCVGMPVAAEVAYRTRDARLRVRCVSDLAVVRTPRSAFDGPDAVERISSLAIDWFGQHLSEIAPLHKTHRVALV
jgi:hypothetical protein